VIDESTTVAPHTLFIILLQPQAQPAGILYVSSTSSRLDFPTLADGRCRYGPVILWHRSKCHGLGRVARQNVYKDLFSVPRCCLTSQASTVQIILGFWHLFLAFSREEAQGYSIFWQACIRSKSSFPPLSLASSHSS